MSLLTAYECDRGIIPMVARMVHNGMPLSVDALQALRPKFKKSQDAAFMLCATLEGMPFNPGSSDQVAAIIHGKHKVPVRYKTEGGSPSTKESYLAVYAADYPKIAPTVNAILEYRRFDQLVSTFIDPLIPRVVDGWIHYNLNITGTSTSRLSSNSPNFQNLPTRDIEGQWIRDCFIAPEGYSFISNDLCLAEGTPVDTPYGPRAIEELRPGDVVFSYGIDRPSATTVKTVWCTGVQQCYQVNLDSGKSFVATGSHKMAVLDYAGDGTWSKVRVSELEPGDRLLPLKRVVTQGRIRLYGHSALKYVKEHKVVAEAVYGPVPMGHDIHHINEVGDDNRPENLEYKKSHSHKSEHATINYPLQDHTLRIQNLQRALAQDRRSYVGEGNPNYGKFQEGPRTCLFCQKEFRRPPSRDAKYCGQMCYRAARAKGLNCKVVSVVPLGKRVTWNIEVAAPTHVFALACGVISSNSQIELRVAAHLSQDAALLHAYRTPGTDLHADTAMRMFGRSDGVWRYVAKTINFAILYGISAEGLYKGLVKESPDGKWSVPQCQGFLDKYFHSHPGIVHYIDQTKAFLHRYGYVEDMFGGRRTIPKVYAASPRLVADAEREATNLPVQGSASRILKLQMAAVDKAMLDLGWYEDNQVRPLLQIHDDLVFLSKDSLLYQASGMIKTVMEEAFSMSVPILVSTKIGKKWGSLKEIEE